MKKMKMLSVQVGDRMFRNPKKIPIRGSAIIGGIRHLNIPKLILSW